MIKLIDKSLWREWWSALFRQGMTVDKWNASILRGSVVLQNNQDLHKNIMRLLASAFAMRRQHLTGSTMLLIILFFFSIIPTATAHADGVPPSLNILKSASELDYPPFAIVQSDGTADGFSVDLLKAVAEAVGMSVSFKVGPWNELKQELIERELDVLPLVSYSKERDKVYDFTAPYLRMNGTIFVRKGNTEIRQLSDLKDKEVLVMKGDTAHEYAIKEKLSDNIITTVSYEEAFDLLASGKHDAIVVQQIVGLQMIKKLHITNVIPVKQKVISSLKPIALKLEGFEQKFCFAVPEGNQDVLSLLNEGLGIVYLNGTYNILYNKWFAPILPTPKVPFSILIKQILSILLPLLLIFTLLGLWFLKRLVNKRTIHLEQEIKHRKIIESELADANAKYEKAQEIGKVGNWEYDINTEKFWGSQETRRIYGFNMDSKTFTTEKVESCIPERERVHQALVDLIEKNEPYNLEFDILTNDTGENRTIISLAELERDSAGNPLKIRGFIQDITDRKKAEETKQKIQATLNAALDSMPDAVSISDAMGSFVEFNTAFAIYHKFAKKEECYDNLLEWHNILDVYLPDGQLLPLDMWPFSRALRGEICINKEYLLRRKDTDEKWTGSYNFAPIREKDGTILGSVVVARDITEQKQLVASLIQAQKMESVGQLAGGVAHDYNNALSVIIGFTELAMGQIDPSGALYADLTEILSAAKRSASITRQLLAFARKQVIAPVVLDLNNTIEGMLKMLRHLIGENIDLTWLPIHEVWMLKIDPSQVDQILANLCINARDAIADVGKITIETDNVTLDKSYCESHAGFTPGQFVLLAVSDDGCGMDKEMVKKVFEPFFTTKEQGKGTGLGLATVYGIVKQNDGFINVYSELNKGTTFKIYLPRYAGDPEVIESKSTIKNTSGHGETVLLVEDEVSLLRLGKRMLQDLDYEVLSANTPPDAISLAQKYTGEINLLITDMIMPGMNGRDLEEHIRAIFPDIKTLFMSGYTADAIARHGVLEEGVHFLSKPFSLQNLAAKVKEAIE